MTVNAISELTSNAGLSDFTMAGGEANLLCQGARYVIGFPLLGRAADIARPRCYCQSIDLKKDWDRIGCMLRRSDEAKGRHPDRVMFWVS